MLLLGKIESWNYLTVFNSSPPGWAEYMNIYQRIEFTLAFSIRECLFPNKVDFRILSDLHSNRLDIIKIFRVCGWLSEND